MKLVTITAILALSATAANAACPWATNGYQSKDGSNTYQYIFSPKCDILVFSDNGSEMKEYPLRKHPQGWIYTTKSGTSFVFGLKGKRVTRIDSSGQISMKMKPAF